MKKKITAVISMVLALVMLFSTVAFAGNGDVFLALGEDLDAKGMTTVLGYFGLDSLDDCNITYITNADEHKYLDGKIDYGRIGTQSLSCVMIKKSGGSKINVELHNINYCTEGMYVNALATAGVKGAKVIVAGPYEISGTAALVGTVKAYEKMTGETVGEDVLDAAVEEITTTGDIGEEIGDKNAVESIIADVKAQLASNPNMSDSEIMDAIRAAASKVGVTLSEANIEKIKNMITKLKGLDIDWSNIKGQSQALLSKLGGSGIFSQIINWFKSLFNR